jgi:hypothetical protein
MCKPVGEAALIVNLISQSAPVRVVKTLLLKYKGVQIFCVFEKKINKNRNHPSFWVGNALRAPLISDFGDLIMEIVPC